MEVSVEELLQTNSVQQLRAIAANLQRESSDKRQELQLMVGSRYHEFIESADTIAAMWTDASTLAAQLAEFTEKCDLLVQHGNKLLLQATSGEYGGDHDDFFPKSVDDQAVWDCLDECDVYGAAVLIVVAAFNHSHAGLQSNNPVLMCLQTHGQSHDRDRESYLGNLNDHSSVLFLSETVAEDAQLLLLDVDATLEQRCKILTSIRYLQGLDDLQCMRKFLDAQDVLLNEVCDGLSANDQNRDQLAARLNEVVALLQRCLLDAYLTFISPCPSNMKESGLQQIANVRDSNSFTLFDAFKVEFGLRVEKRCRATAGSDADILNKATAWTATTSTDVLRETFFQWIMVHITRVATLTKDALSKLSSAAEVSRLQRQVWQQATRFMQDSEPIQRANPNYNAQTWAEASQALLRSPSVRPKVRVVANREDESLMLWSLLFRSTFLQQVESILSSASMSALTRFRQCVNELFNPEGIVIDWENDVRIQVLARSHSIPTSVGNKSSRNLGPDWQAASASKVQRQAEVLYSLLHNETSNLLGDSWLPIEQGDAQSSESFATALYYSYCQLIASMMCTVRVLSISIQSSLLEDDANLLPESKWVLLNALLTLGRFAWLLKSRSKFLEAAFETPSKVQAAALDKVALDQLRSAFEIADTDGDGVLVSTEIHEAIHAITDDVGAINYSHVPSLTFVEFCLFCAKLLDEVQPLQWLTTCLDRLLCFTHETWAEHIVAASVANLAAGLHDLLFIPSSAGELANVICREHFDMWQQVGVSFEDESGVEHTEHVFLPLKPSPPLSVFLFDLETHIQASMLCAETFQRIPAGYPFAGEARDFVALVGHAVRHRAIALLSETYGQLTQQAQQVVKRADIPLFRSAREDLFIQLTMDVEYLKVLHDRSISSSQLTHKQPPVVDGLLEILAANLDPVNAELYLPHLRQLARSAADESQLVTVFPPITRALADAAAQTSSIQPQTLDVFMSDLSSANSSRFLLLPVPTRTQYTTPTPHPVDQAMNAGGPGRSDNQGDGAASNLLPSKAFSLVGEVGASFISSASSMLRSSSSSSFRK